TRLSRKFVKPFPLQSYLSFSVQPWCRSNRIEAADLPPEVCSAEGVSSEGIDAPRDERMEIERALKQARGNRSRAAKILGWSRATFYRKIAVYENA
ncbi:MAG: hypothetical protein O2960_07185, partial [Verrucomicrobia bacterium]|nr:hypothetical protein [Verrucomicrobiota bacterium]